VMSVPPAPTIVAETAADTDQSYASQ
jgi:hypothetical protein